MTEIWKNIEGYENLYQISSIGRVRSLDRFDSIGRFIKGKILKPRIDKDGYHCIFLSKNGTQKPFKIHRLVAQAFIPNPDNKPCIDHVKCVRSDNRLENLRWATHKENTHTPLSIVKYKPPKNKNGCENSNAKQVLQLTKEGCLIQKWGCMKEAADALNIDYIKISKCCRGIQKQTNGSRWEYYNHENYLIGLMNKNFKMKRKAS